MKFPPDWVGEEPPPIDLDRLRSIIKSLPSEMKGGIFDAYLEMESFSFEVDQISYHRDCGGSIISAPHGGDTSNHKQYDIVCSKCGVIKTETLPENSTINFI